MDGERIVTSADVLRSGGRRKVFRRLGALASGFAALIAVDQAAAGQKGKRKRRMRDTQRLKSGKKPKKPKQGVGTVVIEIGETVFAPAADYETTNHVMTASVACSQGVAIGGGCKTFGPGRPDIGNTSVPLNDSYPSSPTEWTIRVSAGAEGDSVTPYVLCLV